MKEMLYEVQCLKSNEDMILALAGQFKQLSHEPEKFITSFLSGMYRVSKSEKSVFKVLVFLCFDLAIKHSSLPTLVFFPLLLSPAMSYGGLWLDCQGLLILNWEQSPCRNCLPAASQPPHYNSVVK